jgi:hypothetical protein
MPSTARCHVAHQRQQPRRYLIANQKRSLGEAIQIELLEDQSSPSNFCYRSCDEPTEKIV